MDIPSVIVLIQNTEFSKYTYIVMALHLQSLLFILKILCRSIRFMVTQIHANACPL